MISAYRWQVRGFLGAMALLVLVQVLLLSAGTLAVLNVYHVREMHRLQAEAQEILLDGSAEVPPHDGPFFVFSADGTLVYSNRGRGRSLEDAELQPVEYEGTVIGFYYAEQVRFLSRTANRFVLISLVVLVAGSSIMGVLIAGISARKSAQRISSSLAGLEQDLHALKALLPVAPTESPITELSSISESLHTVSVALADQDDYKRRWMQDIAHDLRTPLTGLRNQLEGMRDGVLDPSQRRIERTLGDVTRLEYMVDSITELHALEVTRKLEKQTVAGGQFIASISRDSADTFREAGGVLTTRVDCPVISCNESLLKRAVENILTNARRHGGPGVSVTVSLDECESGAELSICNDGPPIPPDQLPRVFQRFFRGEYGRSSGGAGLGLSIAHEIALLHGGSIQVSNQEPSGVCFTITLPADEQVASEFR